MTCRRCNVSRQHGTLQLPEDRSRSSPAYNQIRSLCMNSERIYRYRDRVLGFRSAAARLHYAQAAAAATGPRCAQSPLSARASGALEKGAGHAACCQLAMQMPAGVSLAAGVTAQNRNPPLGQPVSASAPLFIRASVAARIRSLRSDSDPTTTGRCLLNGGNQMRSFVMNLTETEEWTGLAAVAEATLMAFHGLARLVSC